MESMSTDVTTYLENLVNDIFHTVVPAGELDYSIEYVDSDVCFKFVVEYEGLTDIDKIKINNDIIMKRFDILLYKLKRNLYMSYENYVFSVKFEESTIHKTHKDKIIIFITYEKITGGSYIQDVPKEVQLIIANKVDIDTLRGYLSHLHCNEFSDGDFKVALHKLYPKIHDDLVTLIKAYPKLDVGGIWSKLYMSTRDYVDSSEIPYEMPLYDIPDECDTSEFFSRSKFDTMVISLRYKYKYPKFYDNLLTFYLKWNVPFEDWIDSMEILICGCNDWCDEEYISSLDNLLSGKSSEYTDYFMGRGDWFNISNINLLWFILNVPNIKWSPADITDTYYFKLLKFLYRSTPNLEWVKLIDDNYLSYLVEEVLEDNDEASRAPTLSKIFIILGDELKRRNSK